MSETENQEEIINLLNALKELHIFSNLEQDEIFEILKISNIKNFKNGQMIAKEGDVDDNLYVIINGKVEVTSLSEKTGKRIKLFVGGNGLTFGEMSFLDKQPRSASIVTREETETFAISREKFNLLLEEFPIVAAKLLLGLSDILSRRLRGTDQRLKHSI